MGTPESGGGGSTRPAARFKQFQQCYNADCTWCNIPAPVVTSISVSG